MPRYGDPLYWEERYREQEGSTYDWLETWDSLKEHIGRLCGPEAIVLMLGCGNAEMSEDMYDAGYRNIWNIDISGSVIEYMAERNKHKPEMKWKTMDVREIKYSTTCFDLVIDKGTMDALLCGDEAFLNVAKMTREVQRVLKTGGHYVVISYGEPHSRMEHFEWPHLNWEVTCQVVGEIDPHYLYICQKKDGAEAQCQANWKLVEENLTEDDAELLINF